MNLQSLMMLPYYLYYYYMKFHIHTLYENAIVRILGLGTTLRNLQFEDYA